MSDKKKDQPIRACLIANARSGHAAAALSEALPVLAAQGWDVTVREKHVKGEARELARGALMEGYDPIVSCGGDGTLNEIVDALTGTDVTIGTIPAGTANVWPREIGIARRPRVAATQLVASERIRVDIGRVEIEGKHSRHFLMMAGLGADGTVMAHASRSLKNRIGPLAVGLAAVQAISSVRTFPIQLEMDGVRWEGGVSQVLVGNTRHYGGFTQITPEAHIDDGLLDLCLFTAAGVLDTGRQMTSLLLRQHPSESSAELYRAAQIVIHSPTPLPLQLDGSALHQDMNDTNVTYRFSVVHRGLSVLIPRTYAGPLFEHGIGHVLAPRKIGKGKKKKG